MKEKQVIEENKMGTAPINRLMLSMGLPMVLSMMMQALYNIVDSAFVSNMPGIGESALNALTLAFPVQMLMVAIGVGTGVGTNALLARSLGQRDQEKASRVAGNSIFLGCIISVVFIIFGILGVKAYVYSQTTNTLIAELAVEYLQICCIVSFGIVFFSIYEKLLQATGRTSLSTIAQISGAVTNVILDPIMIFGLFGTPALGIAGAAYATVIGQIVSFLLALFFHLKFNKEIKNAVKYMRPSKKVIQQIYAIGLPAIIAQALMSIMTYGLNVIFVRIDESVVTAYGLYYKIQQFILFAAFGLRDAITPIVSFNYGRGNRKRVKEGIRYGLLYTLVIMFVGMLFLEIFANPLSAVFGLSGQTRELCISAMRIVSLSFLFAGANIALQGVFQALEGGVESLIISICRQFLFVLPVAWGFSKAAMKSLDNIWLVWMTFLIAEGISLAISYVFMRGIEKRNLRFLESENDKNREKSDRKSHKKLIDKDQKRVVN
jgi:putative MATE family efflux protein